MNDHDIHPTQREPGVPPQVESVLMVDPIDPIWLSALRGRVLAAIASGVSLATSGTMLYQQLSALAGEGMVGMSADRVTAVANQAASVVDAGLALVVAAASLIGLLASINSKAREWLRARF
jgi:hypothetical protein